MSVEKKQIELLAPAGDFNSLKVAIGNGANSVYFGSNYFSARKKAKNISEEEMEAAIDYAHLRSCKAYLALNTLLLDDELHLAVDLAKLAYSYGIDAIIIQDLGFAALLKKELPDIVLHASTQATIFDEFAIDACACIGFSRIIMPRELSIPEIARLTAYANTKGIETEVFAHGALCVSYSGQCVMSSMIGGRSGNRGECAQPCRLSYDVTVAKRPKNLTAPHLATKDLSAIDHVEELMKAGVSALKIEGRMRSLEYVGVVIHEFYNQIKFVQNKIKFDRFEPSEKGLEKGNTENLLLAFNRGGNFTDHYLKGKKSPDMIAGQHVGSFGVLLGEIAARNSQSGIVEIRRTNEVIASLFPNKGDVISIRRSGKDEEVASAPIGSAVMNGINIRIKGFHPAMIDTMQIGDLVYRMSHSVLAKEVLSSDSSKTSIEGRLSEFDGNLSLKWKVAEGIAKGIEYEEIISKDSVVLASENIDRVSGIPTQRCREQLLKTGGTPFTVVDVEVLTSPSIPVSALNSLRRESLEGLAEKIKKTFKKSISKICESNDSLQNSDYNTKPVILKSAEFNDYTAIEDIINEIDLLDDGINSTESDDNLQTILSNTVAAYFYYWDGDVTNIACNADWYELPIWAFYNEEAFDGLRKLREIEPKSKIAICVPPAYIGESRNKVIELIRLLSKEDGVDAIISGNPGNAWFCQEFELDGFQDSGSNIMNSQTVALFKEFGVQTMAPSIELSIESIASIAKNEFANSSNIIELPAYGKLRLMYSEHCPIGYNRSGCKACDTGVAFALKDRKGVSFPVICHKETCTVDILNGDCLCAPSEVFEISQIANVRARLYFTDEIHQERENLIAGFKQLLDDTKTPDVLRDAEKIRKTAVEIASGRNHGLTKGHYMRGLH